MKEAMDARGSARSPNRRAKLLRRRDEREATLPASLPPPGRLSDREDGRGGVPVDVDEVAIDGSVSEARRDGGLRSAAGAAADAAMCTAGEAVLEAGAGPGCGAPAPALRRLLTVNPAATRVSMSASSAGTTSLPPAGAAPPPTDSTGTGRAARGSDS